MSYVCQKYSLPGEIRVLYNHIYEFKKGVRNMVLCTLNIKYMDIALERLKRQNIPYVVQKAGINNINIYFGSDICMSAIKHIIKKPLYDLSPEEDFILGTILGYDICEQCKRYCRKKEIDR